MQSHYEFNVALNGTHFFATAEKSATNKADADAIEAVLIEKFPPSEGYQISVTYWKAMGDYTKLTGAGTNRDK